jgi:hypothetical protein
VRDNNTQVSEELCVFICTSGSMKLKKGAVAMNASARRQIAHGSTSARTMVGARFFGQTMCARGCHYRNTTPHLLLV